MADGLYGTPAEVISRYIGQPCGRCNGKGTERHQVSRDIRDGYDDWPCPSCSGVGRTVIHASPDVVARWALSALTDAGYEVYAPSTNADTI